MSSYMNDKTRFEMFKFCLFSILQQNENLDELFIGMSFDSKEDYDKNYKELIELIEENNTCLKITIIKKFKRFSQGEMWKEISNFTKYLKDTWVVFTDDDDIWDVNRVKYYKTVLNDKPEKCSAIRSSNYINHENNLNLNIYGYSHVEYFLEKNILKIDKDMPGDFTNYVNFMCNIEIFNDFLNSQKMKLLQHRLCDCFFTSFILTYKHGIFSTLSFEPNTWMYFWRSDNGYKQSLPCRNNQIKNKYGKMKECLEINIPLLLISKNNINSLDFRNKILNCLKDREWNIIPLTKIEQKRMVKIGRKIANDFIDEYLNDEKKFGITR